MVVAISEIMLIAMVGIPGLIALSCMFFVFSIKRNCPEAWTHWQANNKNKVICRVHYKSGEYDDYIGEIDKDEKGLATNYWKVPEVGLKFKPVEVERGPGGLPVANYFEKTPKNIALREAIAYNQLKDYFRKIKVPIDGIEQQALYVLQESEKIPAERAIDSLTTDSKELKEYLRKYLLVVREKKNELKGMMLETGAFGFQTAMKALDDTIAFNGAYMAHAKEVIIAAALRKEEDGKKKLIEMAIIAVILAIAGVILLVGVTQVLK